MWKIYKFKCDEFGNPFGDVVVSDCYTQELADSYKNTKFVVKIEERVNGKYQTIWTNNKSPRKR